MVRRLATLLLFVSGVTLLADSLEAEELNGGMVVSDHPLAAAVGADILARGGNAADAAVATALASGVVQPAGSGLGGGGFAVISSPNIEDPDRFSVLDFREVAPQAASPTMYQGADGVVIEGLSRSGGLAVAVPGEPVGLARLAQMHGTMELEALSEGAVRLAIDGFQPTNHLVEAFARRPLQGLFLSGEPRLGGLILRPRLGEAIVSWAESGGRSLSEGALAEDIVSEVVREGGVLTVADLAGYEPTEREPILGSYRGYTVVTMPPPSSGGVVLLQALSVLENWNLGELEHNSSEHIHLLAETFQHAFADRANHMGDPEFIDVPVERLLSPARIQAIQDSFQPNGTLNREAYGDNRGVVDDAGTQHISVLDADGGAVALTTTINTSFGSGVVAPLSGILLNNEMDDFVSAPGVPNSYGLIGRAENQVEPGKKPLSSMTPTILLKDGEVVMVVGASGGPFIISSTLQVISNVVDFGMTPEEAVSVVRMHHQWVPELLFLDEGASLELHQMLQEVGHNTQEMAFFSSVQVISNISGNTLGAADPRKGGAAVEASASER